MTLCTNQQIIFYYCILVIKHFSNMLGQRIGLGLELSKKTVKVEKDRQLPFLLFQN